MFLENIQGDFVLHLIHPSNIYLRFTLYFVLFSFIVAALTSLVNYNNQYHNLGEDVYQNADTSYLQKQQAIESVVSGIEDDIRAAIVNPIFQHYIANPADSENAVNLLLSLSDANANYFQVRYLNAGGYERIRVEKDQALKESFVVTEDQLQNKSERYYFKAVKLLPANQFWHSRLDLNVEHGRIEQPLRPTLRIASPVFHNGVFSGMVIINADMSQLLTVLQQSFEFDVFLVDGDGYFISHPDKESQWSRYLNSGQRLHDLAPDLANQLLMQKAFQSKRLFGFSLENNFQNGEQIRLVLKAKETYMRGLTMENVRISIYLALLILIISIPTGLLLAVSPARLQQELDDALHENNKALEVIDEYVVTSETDLEGHIKKVSTALCRLSGYDREELVGQKYSVVKSGEMEKSVYQELWRVISKGGIWSGVFKDKAKTGQFFWLDTTIIPKYQVGKMVGYTSVAHDITNEKLIEKISEQDPLTQLYNRVKLDNVLEQEVLRVKRVHEEFSVIMIDVDHFKSVNDNFGHPAGDSVLKELACLLQENTRTVDVVGRWGGEEFMVLCLETPLEGAYELAEKLRAKIEEHHFKYVGHQTASFGVTDFSITDTVSKCIKRADDALYQAKGLGRNQVVISRFDNVDE